MKDSLLGRWIKESGYTVSEIAALCGVSRSAVYNWCYGISAPNVQHLAVLHRISHGGVQPWWFTTKPDGGAHDEQR